MSLIANPLTADARLNQIGDPDYAAPELARGRFELLIRRNPHPTLQGVIAVEAVGTTADDALATAATDKAADRAAEILQRIRAEAAATVEGQAEQAAREALDRGRAELAAVERKLTDAKAAYDTAVAAGLDPRPHRRTLTAAEAERGEVGTWVASLDNRYDAAKAKLATLVTRGWRRAAAEELAALPARRAALAARLPETVLPLVASLLEVAALEAAFARDMT